MIDTRFSSVIVYGHQKTLAKRGIIEQCKLSCNEERFYHLIILYQPHTINTVDSIKKAVVLLTFTMPICLFWLEKRP